MTHLSPHTFVDLLDGTLAEAAVPHLASCNRCRRQLSELRVTWKAAAESEVPEPSPLFWDHLSARVHDAVADEGLSRAPWLRIIDWSWTSVGLFGAAVATLALVAFLQLPRSGSQATSVSVVSANAAAASAFVADAEPVALPDDESIGLMADLASGLDWDDVAELGLTTDGLADRATSEMTADERVELQRLLHEALTPAGT